MSSTVRILICIAVFTILVFMAILMEKRRVIIMGITLLFSVVLLVCTRQWKLYMVTLFGGFLIGLTGGGMKRYQKEAAVKGFGGLLQFGMIMAVFISMFFMMLAFSFPELKFEL